MVKRADKHEDKSEEESVDEEEAGEEAELDYDEVSQFEDVRDVDMPEDLREGSEELKAGQGVASLTESVEQYPDMSDMQIAQIKLFPSDLGTKTENRMMISRLEPSAFLPLIRLMVSNDLMTSDPEKRVDVNDMILKNYILASVGLEGKGRIDHLELAGAAREQKLLTHKLRYGEL